MKYFRLGRVLLRGRYMAAAIERNGVPLDVKMLADFREHWEEIKQRATLKVDKAYGVFVPTKSWRIDSDTRLGAAILGTAADLDPLLLTDASRTETPCVLWFHRDQPRNCENEIGFGSRINHQCARQRPHGCPQDYRRDRREISRGRIGPNQPCCVGECDKLGFWDEDLGLGT